MCLSDNNRSNLQVNPRCHNSILGCCDIDKHSSGLLSRKAILDVLRQQGDLGLIYGSLLVSKPRMLLRE